MVSGSQLLYAQAARRPLCFGVLIALPRLPEEVSGPRQSWRRFTEPGPSPGPLLRGPAPGGHRGSGPAPRSPQVRQRRGPAAKTGPLGKLTDLGAARRPRRRPGLLSPDRARLWGLELRKGGTGGFPLALNHCSRPCLSHPPPTRVWLGRASGSRGRWGAREGVSLPSSRPHPVLRADPGPPRLPCRRAALARGTAATLNL